MRCFAIVKNTVLTCVIMLAGSCESAGIDQTSQESVLRGWFGEFPSYDVFCDVRELSNWPSAELRHIHSDTYEMFLVPFVEQEAKLRELGKETFKAISKKKVYELINQDIGAGKYYLIRPCVAGSADTIDNFKWLELSDPSVKGRFSFYYDYRNEMLAINSTEYVNVQYPLTLSNVVYILNIPLDIREVRYGLSLSIDGY